jgi:phage tail-like protein
MEEPNAILKLTGPDLERDEVTLTRGGMTVGRVKGNDLVLSHQLVSRQHMRFTWREGSFWIEDLGSRNGTWMGERRLQPHVAERFSPGDAIRVGPYVLAFVRMMAEEPEEVAPPLPPAAGTPEVSALEPAPPSPPSRLPDESFLPPSEPPRSLRPPPPNGHPVGIPRDRSNWLQYLPAIYAEADFTGRYLLIFESVMAPIIWLIDNFDVFLSPGMAPAEWLGWMASWFDLLLLPSLPVERQRAIMSQVGWLFLRRGTRAGLERLLDLYFDVKPEIIEGADQPCHFTVRLRVDRGQAALSRAVAERLIEAQKPAFAGYTLEME